jgi:hypothetical protein
MATADISEYWSLARDASGQVAQVGAEPSIVDQQLTIGSEVKSAAFKGSFIRVHVDAACRIQFGPDPTASSATMRLAAGTTQYFGVIPGHKIPAKSKRRSLCQISPIRPRSSRDSGDAKPNYNSSSKKLMHSKASSVPCAITHSSVKTRMRI